jgi:hypothetical protein
MGREEPPEPVDTPQKTKRARLSWDPDSVPERCEILAPSECRLVDINTTRALLAKALHSPDNESELQFMRLPWQALCTGQRQV